MKFRNLILPLGIIAGATTSALLAFDPVKLQAQSLPVSLLAQLEFPDTGGGGIAREGRGGGTRAGSVAEACVVDESKPLTVLMPQNNVGTTVTETPTLYWYAPQTRAQEAEFVLLDEQNNEVYATTFPLSRDPRQRELSKAGIVQLTLPKSATGESLLQAGEKYSWFLALVCNRDDRSYDEIIEGVVERQEIDSQLQAIINQEVSPVKKADLYARAAIWTDALMILAEIRHSKPEQWESFLSSVNLEKIAREPFVDCCTQEN